MFRTKSSYESSGSRPEPLVEEFMFGDDYIRKIGLATENAAKAALFKFLFAQYVKNRMENGKDDRPDEDFAATLAAAVTNRVFGEDAANDAGKQFAAQNAELISILAHMLSADDRVCAVLSGAAYNTCYARYVGAGGSRGMFSNAFLAYVRTLSRDDSYATTRAKALDRIVTLGSGILKPIESMLSLGIFRPLPDSPNERSFYDDVHHFATIVGAL